MNAIYNEIEPFAVDWLRNLASAGHVTGGVVDDRSIRDLVATDVAGPGQRHFFAGIGVWSHALRLAGWPDDLDVWTGSCPCQPFSAAGRKGGFDDDRHLWPDWFRLIRECRPPVVLGEQVASPDGLAWLDLVRADLEGAGYAFGAADLCAAGVGAPHIRQRLYFVGVGQADSDRERLARIRVQLRERRSQQAVSEAGRRGEAGELADAECERGGARGIGGSHGRAPLEPDRHGDARVVGDPRGPRHDGREDTGADRGNARERAEEDGRRASGDREPERAGAARVVGDADAARLEGVGHDSAERQAGDAGSHVSSATRGFWSGADWIPCRDGKLRPVEPGTFPLAHGATGRVGKLRAYGNAIVPEVAQAWVESVIDYLVEDVRYP